MPAAEIVFFRPAARIDPHLDSRVRRGREHTTVTVSARRLRLAVHRLELQGLSVGGRAEPRSAAVYKVRLTNADYEALRARRLAVPDPYQPETIPCGVRVLLGSTLVERLGGGAVRVTHGPVRAVQRLFATGAPVKVASLRFDSVELELAHGRPAYDLLLKDGTFPHPCAGGVLARRVIVFRRQGGATTVEEEDLSSHLTTVRRLA